MAWLMRGLGEQSRVAVRDVTRDESEAVPGESSRSPLSHSEGRTLLYKMGRELTDGFKQGNHMS